MEEVIKGTQTRDRKGAFDLIAKGQTLNLSQSYTRLIGTGQKLKFAVKKESKISTSVIKKSYENPKYKAPKVTITKNTPNVKAKIHIPSISKTFQIEDDYSIVEAPEDADQQQNQPENENMEENRPPTAPERTTRKFKEKLLNQSIDRILTAGMNKKIIYKRLKLSDSVQNIGQVTKYLNDKDHNDDTWNNPMRYLVAPKQFIDLEHNLCLIVYPWVNSIGFVIYNKRARMILKTQLLLINEIKARMGLPSALPQPRNSSTLGQFIDFEVRYRKKSFWGPRPGVTENQILLDGLFAKRKKVCNIKVVCFSKFSDSFYCFMYLGEGINRRRKPYVLRVSSILNVEQNFEAEHAPFTLSTRNSTQTELVEVNSEKVALISSSPPVNSWEFLIKIWVGNNQGKLKFTKKNFLLEHLPKESNLVRSIIVEDMKPPLVKRLENLVFVFAGHSYISVVDLQTLQNPSILKYRLTQGVILRENVRIAACDDLRAVSCPGLNTVALLKMRNISQNKKEYELVESRLVSLGDGLEGIRAVGDLEVSRSARLFKLENFNMLYLAQGGRRRAEEVIIPKDIEKAEELGRLRRSSIFGFELKPTTLELVEKEENGQHFRYLDDFNLNLGNVIGIGNYFVFGGAHDTAPEEDYLTLMDKELNIVDQFRQAELRDSESLVSLNNFGQVVSFSKENSFMIHRIDEISKELVFIKILTLTQEIKRIRFSEHFNTPRESFMVLITDSKDRDHLAEFAHFLELKPPKIYTVIQQGDSVIIDKDRLFQEVNIRPKSSPNGKTKFLRFFSNFQFFYSF